MTTTTFGSFPAAETLAALLDELNDPHVSKKVSRLLQDFNEGLRQLEMLSDEQYRGRLALLWRDDFLRRVNIEPEVDKFVRNVIATRAKRLLSNEND